MGKRFVNFVVYLFHCVLSVIYPDQGNCLGCGEDGDFEGQLCALCSNKLKLWSTSGEIAKEGAAYKVYSASYYSKLIKELIIRLKYKSDFCTGEFLVNLLLHVVSQYGLEFDIITFVPSGKLAKRI